MEKSKVLVVGGTGYIGKRLVKASLAEGHETYILHRPENKYDIDKVQMLLSFKEQGAHLVLYDFNLCYNLMRKSLLERAMTYKKFIKQFQILPKKKKTKNLDIKTSKRPKNIKESDVLLIRNY